MSSGFYDMKKNKYMIMLLMLLFIFSAAGCGSKGSVSDAAGKTEAEQKEESGKADNSSEAKTAEEVSGESGSSEQPGAVTAESSKERILRNITQEEAKQIMAEGSDYIILDVRRQDEYDAGHIPGAICVPNESIGTEEIPELPDKDRMLLVYCRSGRRSKEASAKLAELGYTCVLEFGGIIDWTGEIVTDETSEAAGLKLFINGQEMPVTWEDNASVDALRGIVSKEELTIGMSMYGGFEQVGPIGEEVVRNDEQTTTAAGDIVLYSGDQIVVFYGSNTWAYTRLGHIDLAADELEELLGREDAVLILKMAE